jgi:chlorobactene glucosyltransferase
MSIVYFNYEFVTLMAALGILIITLAISVAWSYFLIYMVKSFRESPKLQQYAQPCNGVFPRVSVIVPARNEEDYISGCLDSLIKQDYPNFEIILIDDSSKDRTWEIMQNYTAKYNGMITSLRAGPRPHGWVGKNWACYRGYLLSKGDLLLFTDADTKHSASTMRSAVQFLGRQNFDAITLIPRLLCRDFWTRITLPLLTVFLHTRFSALRVNNPATKIGYFFGSFYLITRTAYEAVGTHNLVRQELVEDGALGAELKRRRFAIKMVKGEQYVTAVWARDFTTLWHGLRRLLIPIYTQKGYATVFMMVAVIFLLLMPFILMPFSMGFYVLSPEFVSKNGGRNNVQVVAASVASAGVLGVALIFLCAAVQSKLGVFQSPLYALFCPLAAVIICSCFLSSLYDATKGGSVMWRGRQYNVTEYADVPSD